MVYNTGKVNRNTPIAAGHAFKPRFTSRDAHPFEGL